MTDGRILDIFYNKIVPEAAKGKVDCYFMFNVAFNLVIDNVEVSKCEKELKEGIITPALKITNKELFNSLLVEYVRTALEFYSPSAFPFLDDIEREYKENAAKIKEEYLVKYIIVATLLANASLSDFQNPFLFLKSRIAMFNNKIIPNEEIVDLGYINSIGAKIFILEEKSPIKAETPYCIKSYLEFDDGYKLCLPEIYAGNTSNKYQLYGIQKTSKSNELEERPYLKQIRKGFIAKINGAPEHYFLAVMLFISLCSDKEIEVIPFLVERWNAKRAAMFNKKDLNQYLSLLASENGEDLREDYVTDKLAEYFASIEEKQDKLQSSITDNLIRYFTKLGDVTGGMNFTSIPFEADINLKLKISESIESRSVAFNDLFQLVKDYKERENNLGR